jgi:VanZ family protein
MQTARPLIAWHFSGQLDCERGINHMALRRLIQVAAWTCVTAIVALSLVSPAWRPVTILPHNLEHLAIFIITGFALGLGYPGRLERFMALLIVFAGAIELAQFVAPGRHPRLIDFVVDAAGACAGALVAALIARACPGLIRD